MPASQAGRRRFESGRPLQKLDKRLRDIGPVTSLSFWRRFCRFSAVPSTDVPARDDAQARAVEIQAHLADGPSGLQSAHGSGSMGGTNSEEASVMNDASTPIGQLATVNPPGKLAYA